MSEHEKIQWGKIGWVDNLFDFGKYILKPRRKELKKTQTDIAKKLKVHQTSIHGYENSGSSPLRMERISKLLDEYDLPEFYRTNYRFLCSGSPNIQFIEGDNKNFTTEEFIIYIDNELARIKKMMDSGSTRLASNWMDEEILPKLWKRTNELALKNDIETSRMANRLAKCIHLNLDSKTVWMDSKTAVLALQEGIDSLKTLYELSDDYYPLLVSSLFELKENYLRGNEVKAVQLAKQVQDLIKNKKIVDPNLMWQNLSIWAVCGAKSGSNDVASEPIEIFSKFMDNHEVGPIIYRQYFETSARTEGLTKSSLFWKKHEKANDLVFGPRGIPKDPYTATLLIRNEIEAMIIFNDLSRSRMNYLLNKAKLISGKNYARLLEEIEGKINKV